MFLRAGSVPKGPVFLWPKKFSSVLVASAWYGAQSIICFALVFAPSPNPIHHQSPLASAAFFATNDILYIALFKQTTN